jgi:hypothetical protein
MVSPSDLSAATSMPSMDVPLISPMAQIGFTDRRSL